MGIIFPNLNIVYMSSYGGAIKDIYMGLSFIFNVLFLIDK